MDITQENGQCRITLPAEDLDALASMAIDAMSAAQYRMDNSRNGEDYSVGREAYEWYKNCYSVIAAALGYPEIE